MRGVAQAISVLLHPLLMPLLTLWLLLEQDPHLLFPYLLEAQPRMIVLGMIGVITIVFPILSLLMLQRGGLVSSMTIPLREERIAPYLFTLMYYGLCYYLLRRTLLHEDIYALFFGATLALLLTTLITLRWKISAHMVGIGGQIGALIALNLLHGSGSVLSLLITIVMAGVLGTSRLLVSDHTAAQVYVGALLGTICVSAAMLGGWMV